MEKFKIGDKVKLRDDLIVYKHYDYICLLPQMKAWFDKHKIAVVQGCTDRAVWVVGNGYFYSCEMIEKV